jgi:16S rRNA (guanine966-N2)-methyltransferase
MRIISGTLGGRHFSTPNGRRTHPMSDKMRGAIFSALGDIEGLSVLDCFAGSGGLAYEALSRGAATATLVEHDRSAQVVIEENIRQLELKNQAKLIRAGVGSWLETSTETFDIVLADPPYDDINAQLIERLTSRVTTTGIFVLSYPGKLAPPTLTGMKTLTVRNYGDAQLIYYRPN